MVFDPAVCAADDTALAAGFAGFCQFGKWQHGERERTAYIDFTGNADLSAVCLNNGATEKQPQPGAAYLSSVAVVAVKLVENVRQDGAIDADTKIFHARFY